MKERERNINVWLALAGSPAPGDLAYNPGMCPDWESNQSPFGLQAGAQPTEPNQPGLLSCLKKNLHLRAFCHCLYLFILKVFLYF